MRITLHQLKVFAQVARSGSVTQAAHELHMTQPAVSNIIRQLEEHYACQLTEVIARRLYLTSFGQLLVQACQQIDDILANTNSEMKALQGGISGELRLASVSTARYFVPRLLGKFKHKYPDVKIRFTVCNRHDITERLQANLDDFVIMSHPPNLLAIDVADFFEDELVIAAAKDHPQRNSKTPLRLNQLKTEDWLFREEGSGTRFATENIFKRRKFSPYVAMEIGDNEAIKQTIMAGMGISVLSKQSIMRELKDKSLSLLPVAGFPQVHTWYLVKNKNKLLSPTTNAFYQLVTKHSPKFSDNY